MKNNRWLMVVLVILFLCICCLAVVLGALFFGGQAVNDALQGYGLPALAPASAPEPAVGAPAQPAGAVSVVTGASPVIYLAGRTDISIPALSETSSEPLFACRPVGVVQETKPFGYQISAGATFNFLATGQINFYGGPEDQGFPPDGSLSGELADLEGYGGISGYRGPAGALVGVFLSDEVPNGLAPERLSFVDESSYAPQIDFARLEPALGQVFFIGDGRTLSGLMQEFVAPAAATRLFVGLADGSGFYGAPTCYTDNVGSFTYQIQSSGAFEPIP